MVTNMSQRKNDLIEELTKLLEEQDSKDLDEILDLVVEMIKEYKHFSLSRHYR
jgi:hypothetical protein